MENAEEKEKVENLSSGVETNVSSYIYAIGQVQVRYPSLAVEKEFAQAIKRAGTVDLTDRKTLHTILSKKRIPMDIPEKVGSKDIFEKFSWPLENRYLARQLCWVLTIEGLEHYILQPRDPLDLDLLVQAIRPTTPKLADIDIVIGLRGPLAPPEMCNGLIVPIVVFDQLYSLDVDSLVKSIPRPETITVKEFEPVAEELFMRIIQMADNAGATDEHRALNYLAVRYPRIYTKAVEEYRQRCSLTAVEVRPSRLGSIRKVVDAIFSYTNRDTDVIEKFFVRVDVTEAFPFLVTALSPYYDR